MWIALSLAHLFVIVSAGSRFDTLEIEFFSLANRYHFKAFDPQAEIDHAELYTFIAETVFLSTTFLASFYGLTRRRMWGIYVVCLHVVCYYALDWHWLDDVEVSFRSDIILSSLIDFVTGIFLCSAFWVVGERETTSTAQMPPP
jgi:hypothetical protein